jgi:hypothetical protein
MLTLELVIFGSHPLSGQIGPVGTPDRIAFHGWIDLMSAIHTLCDDRADTLPAPSRQAPHLNFRFNPVTGVG